MLGEQIRSELHRPLGGDRRFVTRQQGEFTLRSCPEHVAHVLAEKARLRVEEDVRNYRRMLNRRRVLDVMELTQVHDPFEGFWDPSDFGPSLGQV